MRLNRYTGDGDEQKINYCLAHPAFQFTLKVSQMITFSKHVLTARWSSDFWVIDGDKHYFSFRKTVRPYAITYGFIFFNLAVILGIHTDEA